MKRLALTAALAVGLLTAACSGSALERFCRTALDSAAK